MKIIKRRSRVNNGLIFFSEDRSFQSAVFSSEEEREQAIDKYLETHNKALLEREERVKQEKELLSK